MYWCSMGTTGSSVPKQRPISRAHSPPAFTTDAARDTRFTLDLPVQLDRVVLKPRDTRIAVQSVHPAGRVPRRPCGQLTALEQDDIGPSEFRKVVQHTAADHSATDDGHPGM